MGLQFYKRLNVYKTGNANLTWCPEKQVGHSYRWYEIAKRIKGKLVLNVYKYSVTTSGHVGELHWLFKEQGLEFVEVQAPRGLQNINEALPYTLECIESLKLKMTNARKTSNWDKQQLAELQTQLETLKGLGLRVTKVALKNATDRALKTREIRLQRQRDNRERAKENTEKQQAAWLRQKARVDERIHHQVVAHEERQRPSLSLEHSVNDGLPSRPGNAKLSLV